MGLDDLKHRHVTFLPLDALDESADGRKSAVAFDKEMGKELVQSTEQWRQKKIQQEG